LLGTLLGWFLRRRDTQDDREHAEKALLRQRSEGAAEALKEDLISIPEVVPIFSMNAEAALPNLRDAYEGVRRAWSRVSIVHDQSVDRGLRALDMVLVLAIEESEATPLAEEISYWPIGQAIEDLRATVDAYLLREPPPVSTFFTSTELVEIAGSDAEGVLQKINRAARKKRRDQAHSDSRLGQGRDERSRVHPAAPRLLS
jgi:hypothetical protein